MNLVAAATTAGAVEVSFSGEVGEGGCARAAAAAELPSLLLRKPLVLAQVLVLVLVYVNYVW